jgi:hypothetical protein
MPIFLTSQILVTPVAARGDSRCQYSLRVKYSLLGKYSLLTVALPDADPAAGEDGCAPQGHQAHRAHLPPAAHALAGDE